MFIFEILIYIVFAYLMHNLGKSNYHLCEETNETSWNRYLTYYVAFYTVICAIRYNVGVDCLSYIRIFENGTIVAEREEQEVLWNWLVKFIYSNHLGSVIGLGVCAFIQIYFLTRSLQKHPIIVMMLPLVLFGGRYYLDLNAAVRQMTAACIIFWGTQFIASKQLVKYVGTVLIASMFHHSALILLPFYLLPNNFEMASRRVVMLVIFGLCFILGQTPSFQGVIQYAVNLTNLSGYEEYSNRVSEYLIGGQTAEALSFGPMMLSYFLIALFLIWFGQIIKDEYFEKDQIFNLWYNLSFFYACCYFLIANVSHIFIRPVMYFEIFQMVNVSMLLSIFLLRSINDAKYQYLYYGFLAIIWLNIVWDIAKNYHLKWNASTYKVFFLK